MFELPLRLARPGDLVDGVADAAADRSSIGTPHHWASLTVLASNLSGICPPRLFSFTHDQLAVAPVHAGQGGGRFQLAERAWPSSPHRAGAPRNEDARLANYTRSTAPADPPQRAESVAYVSGINRNPCLRYGHLEAWRRGRDSNPRYPCEYAAFRVRCFQPLSHLSEAA